MSNREDVKRLVKGELSDEEAFKVYKRLYTRTEREIIDDLKAIDFDSLVDTEECLDDYLDSLEDNEVNRETIESTEKSLQYLHKAIKERMQEMIAAEHKLKEMLS
jgi:uncharacterized protein YdcH (DUF465 family)